MAGVLIWVTYQHPANSLSYKCPGTDRPVMPCSKSFHQIIPNCRVLLSTDNMTLEAYLSKEGDRLVTNLVIHGDQSVRLVHEMTGSLCQGS